MSDEAQGPQHGAEPDGPQPDAAAGLLARLRELDAAARLEPREGKPRHCTNARCLCGMRAVLHGHQISLGHASLDAAFDAVKLCARVAATPCDCCKAARAASKREARAAATPRRCFTCNELGHVVAECPQSRCNGCGRTGHVLRDCTLGSSTARDHQFVQCAPSCFARRFVVPLHRARSDFGLACLTSGRVDVAARLVSAALISSQRTRRNSQLWLPFLGGGEPAYEPLTACLSGGLARGLQPNELSNATRLRHAIDALGPDGGPPGAGPSPVERELSGFRVLRGGLREATREALGLAREGGTRAPLLLLVQDAPPLPSVLAEHGASLDDLVVVLGDDIGISADELEVARRVGAEAGGGGPLLRASLGAGCLLASQCIVILHHYLDALHDCPARLWDGGSEVRRSTRQKRRQLLRAQGSTGKPVAYLPHHTKLCQLEHALDEGELDEAVRSSGDELSDAR